MPRRSPQPRTRKQPQRTCVACRQIEGKRTLLRLVRSPDGAVELDPSGKKSGRGAYVHASPECIQQVLSSGSLARALKVEPGTEVKEQLRAQIPIEAPQS